MRSNQVDVVSASGLTQSNYKAWDPVYLVLRPNLISIYKREDENGLRHQLNLADVSAVALRSERRRKGEHEGVFGLFSPSRNFHLEAESMDEAVQWVENIRKEARLDAEDKNMILSSPEGTTEPYAGYGRGRTAGGKFREPSSSPEAVSHAPNAHTSKPISIPHTKSTHDAYASGNEAGGSFSDYSDTPFGSALDISPGVQIANRPTTASTIAPGTPAQRTLYGGDRNARVSALDISTDEARVVRHGFLLCLKKKGAIRQWRKYWVVLRATNLALYKSEKEYSAVLILPMASICDAVDTEPLSKSKQFCMQVITEDRSYRFCAYSEDELDHWLGCIKSILVKRREVNHGVRQG